MFHYPGHVMGYMHTVHSGIPTPSSHISALRVEALYAFRQHSWDHHPSCPVARVPTDARDNGSPDCIACPMYSLLLDQQSALVVGARTAFLYPKDTLIVAPPLSSYTATAAHMHMHAELSAVLLRSATTVTAYVT